MPASSTVSAPPRRDPALDGLRGAAVLLVFLFHYGGGLHVGGVLPHVFGSFTQAGWIGVEQFFVLSGFLITSILLKTTRQRRALQNFFLRRALRILPLYSFALLTAALIALLMGAHLANLKPLAVYAGFLQNLPSFVNAALHTPPPLPVFHLWSLAVEVQFYLVWPLLVLLVRTPAHLCRLSLALFVSMLLVRVFLFTWLPPAHALLWMTCLPLRAGSLMLGSAFAAQRTGAFGRGDSALIAWPHPALAFALFVLLGLQQHSFLLDGAFAFCLLLPVASLLCASVLAYTLQPGAALRLLTWQPLPWLGRISYGIYVFHILLQPVFDTLARVLTHSASGALYQTMRLACALPLTVAVAAISFRVIERPFLRWGRRFPEPAPLPAMP